MRALLILCTCLICSFNTVAAEKLSAYQLIYDEKEQGTDFYSVTYTVSDFFIRVDDDNIDSGYILFDIKRNTIFSVSHFDESILVIPEYVYKKKDITLTPDVSYEIMVGAPKIAGKQVYSYRVTSGGNKKVDTCMDIKVAEGLLPEITSKLKHYQKIITGQQIKNIATIPQEYRTPCYMIDQVYNEGGYFDKGLPVHEWHSNNKVRMLRDMGALDVEVSVFVLPEGYREYKLEEAFE